MYTIAVAGHICLDATPLLGSSVDLVPGRLVEIGALSISPGGSVANTGGVLSALGARVVPFANIGEDDLGALLLGQLARLGLEAGKVTVTPGDSTSYSLVIEKPGTDRTLWHHTGANAHFDGSGVVLDKEDIFHLGYPPLLPALVVDGGRPLRDLLARARANGATTSVDLAVVDPTSQAGSMDWQAIFSTMAPHIDVLSPSFDDLTSAFHINAGFSVAMVDRLSDRLIEAGVAVVAISAGHHGLFIRTACKARLAESGHALSGVSSEWSNRRFHAAPVRVDGPVTTNGAGDATSAGLAFALAAGASLEEAADLACACSAAVMSGRRPTPNTIAEFFPALSHLFQRVVA